MEENEFLLQDRLGVIRDTINKYGEDNFYVSFSGGKDSTVIHHLVDMALPNNKIPRVYSNTGIEYNSIVEFVKELAKTDDRFVIIKPSVNIKKTLETYGYPFKSKLHSHHYKIYLNNKEEIEKYRKQIADDPKLLEDYDFITNLPSGVKTIIKYIYNVRTHTHTQDRQVYKYDGFP